MATLDGDALAISGAKSIKLLEIEQLVSQPDTLLSKLAEEAETLEWDLYDIRKEEVAAIEEHAPVEYERYTTELKQYYCDGIKSDCVQTLLAELPASAKKKLAALIPYRRRNVSQFELVKDSNNMWCIHDDESHELAQTVEDIDIRSLPREFPPLSTSVRESDEFQELLLAVAHLVEEQQSLVEKLTITCWHTASVAAENRSASNAPEGIHQDGADFIISALVLDRKNVSGGTSRIFGPDKETLILEHTLEIGQGIFQADGGSDLWHDVTPVQVIKQSEPEGVRRTLGLDIVVHP